MGGFLSTWIPLKYLSPRDRTHAVEHVNYVGA
jgi:hypothetical protein